MISRSSIPNGVSTFAAPGSYIEVGEDDVTDFFVANEDVEVMPDFVAGAGSEVLWLNRSIRFLTIKKNAHGIPSGTHITFFSKMGHFTSVSSFEEGIPKSFLGIESLIVPEGEKMLIPGLEIWGTGSISFDKSGRCRDLTLAKPYQGLPEGARVSVKWRDGVPEVSLAH